MTTRPVRFSDSALNPVRGIGTRLECLYRLFIVLVISLPASYALAQEQKDPDSEARDTRTQQQEPQFERRAAAPATRFTPSEKIKADSSVAFPVDI